jgi:hypothetical protein
MVPRVMQREKAPTVPLDVYTERTLGLAESDGCLTSYGYAFMEGGWPAVFIVHALLGLGLALISKKAMAGLNPLWWLACAFGWEVVLQMETELLPESLSALRCVLVYGVILQLCSMGRRQDKVSAAHKTPMTSMMVR